MCSGGGETAGGRWVVSSSRGWGEADSTQGERVWRSFQRQKVERGLLLLIHTPKLKAAIGYFSDQTQFILAPTAIRPVSNPLLSTCGQDGQNMKARKIQETGHLETRVLGQEREDRTART